MKLSCILCIGPVVFHSFHSINVLFVNMNHLLISIRYSIISNTTYSTKDVQMVLHRTLNISPFFSVHFLWYPVIIFLVMCDLSNATYFWISWTLFIRCEYILSFKNSLKKKSRSVKSGDRGSQAIRPCVPIHLFGYFSFEYLPVWELCAGALSCWKYIICRMDKGISVSCKRFGNLNFKNFLCLCPQKFLLQKYGPIIYLLNTS